MEEVMGDPSWADEVKHVHKALEEDECMPRAFHTAVLSHSCVGACEH